MTNAMNYASEILYDVRDVLISIKERGGLTPTSFIQATYDKYSRSGRYAGIVVNVALVAMGKQPAVKGYRPWEELSDRQIQSLVERAKQQNGLELQEIAQLRAAKGK